ncbi:MAG: diadenylate cyclase CdaA [Rikenellaceae bacterium]|nr:diadenylate cyclase CdaA [Rikenellaceae bacterium]MBP3612201.1 diadenylate cyclase CdaA [Rikenellaceae bacterium]MBR2502170.1 diadenylate cyclase CdaA [Rikenellaceae bacterium]MBR4055258.1 diadenylate cyclase CdaA [Rikenellaceae bacterium]
MGFIHIGIIDIIDIFLVAMMLYYLYRVTRGTNAFSIILGVVMLYLMYVVVRALNMELLSGILGQFIGVGIIAVVVIFQPEIRRFLQMLGLQQNQRISRFFGGENNEDDLDVDSLVKACIDMGETKTGALIVLQQTSDLSLMAEGGIAVDAKVSPSLLENLFFKNSPLHDGAIIINRNRVVAARCILPSTQSQVPKSYGTRHRAALGMSEVSDAIILVVSEETGALSIAQGGVIQRDIEPEKFKSVLVRRLNMNVERSRTAERFFRRFKRNHQQEE